MPPAASPTRLARLLHGLWKVPAYEPYLHPPLVDADVAALEARLGVRLPATYLAALRVQNGGYVRRRFPELVQTRLFGIGPAAPALGPFPLVDPDGWRPRTPGQLVPFDGDGHWFTCLDYRKDGPRAEPSVSLVDVELESERRLAGSFDAFLARCDVDAFDPVLGLVAEVPLVAAAARLGEALRLPAQDDGTQLQGFHQLHFALGTRAEPAWATIAANEQPRSWWPVARGERPPEVAHLVGTALRWPDHPHCHLVVQASREVSERVVAACTRAFGAAPVVIVA